ncbi:hypothetical protein PYW07_014009 [Mythimna separata]|uniref:Protein cueball n=1 Tax=Mythimna separata TaxID=271217 RepID=A0AAD7YG75_MYTSE|nr:hypothetical protein PYW07_014009 [Mythimna separata]
MYKVQCSLVVVALYIGVVFSWDYAISVKHELIFYTNGIPTSTINLSPQNPTSLVYDEVHNMMLYVDKQNNNDSVCGYDLSSKHNKCFIKSNGHNIHGLAYDPVTEKVFYTDTDENSINFISMKRGSDNNIYGESLIVNTDGHAPLDIAVDSCKGYIYWTHSVTDGQIEKVQFDGSDRKGNCSIKDDGLPQCSCIAGYSGERCEISACHGFCLNDGDCSLNEEDEPRYPSGWLIPGTLP